MSTHSDDGLSLVEVIVAMFLLAVLSLAVLPLLIAGVSLSVDNGETVAATAVANDRIALLRDEFPTSPDSARTCTALVDAIAAADTGDPNNPDLTISTVAAPDDPGDPVCPASASAYPRSVLVTVTVIDGSGNVTRVPTRFTVGGA